MRRQRRLLLFLAAGALVFCALFVHIGYKSLGWGGYVYVNVAAPWKR